MIPIATVLALESLETPGDKFYQPTERPRLMPADAFPKREAPAVPIRLVETKPANIWNAEFKESLGFW